LNIIFLQAIFMDLATSGKAVSSHFWIPFSDSDNSILYSSVHHVMGGKITILSFLAGHSKG